MRGLILALFALCLIAGDSGHLIEQLLRNAQHASAINSDERVLTDVTHDESQALNINSTVSVPPTLTQYDTIHHVAPLLWSAAEQGSVDAQTALVTLASSASSEYWLRKVVTLGNPEAAWALYQLLNVDGKGERFIELAAQGGVAEAQLSFAMSTDNPEERERWLIEAANNDYSPAQAALADWYLLKGESHKAKPWLKMTADLDRQSAFKFARLLWDEGDKQQAIHYFKKSAGEGNEQAKRALHITQTYSETSPRNVSQIVWPTHKMCKQRIQLFGTSLVTMTRADSLYSQYQNDNRLKDLSLCVNKPIWLERETLTCSANFQKSGLLGCNITPLAGVAKRFDITHAVIVSAQGKANVRNGVMFLDITDAYSVFVHELAHFAGFVDEYPLSSRAARRLCLADNIENFTPPNLIVEGEITYQPLETVDHWFMKNDASFVIAPSKTCDAIGVKGYKPSDDITFMEHHDTGRIPPIYLALWEQQLQNESAHRPISMNFFQAFHQAGNTKKAGVWLHVYEERGSASED